MSPHSEPAAPSYVVPRRLRWIAVLNQISLTLALAALVPGSVVMLWWRLRWEAAIIALGTKLPSFTMLVLGFPAWLMVVSALAGALGLLFKERRIESQTGRLMLNVLGLIAAGLAWGAVAAACWLPFDVGVNDLS